MHFAGGQTEKQNIYKSNDVKEFLVYLCLWCYRKYHEVKHAENLGEHVEGATDKVREHIEGVMDKNCHCAGSIST